MTSGRRVYRVRARRSGTWWALDTRDVRGFASQARRLDRAEAAARDAIRLLTDMPDDAFEIEIHPDLGDEIAVGIARLGAARTEARDLRARIARLQGDLAAELADRHGLPVRDIGVLLGISHQRVAQILAGRAGIDEAGTDAGAARPSAA